MAGRMVFFTPTLTPVGGVVKIFDYMNHACRLGYSPHLVCPEPLQPDSKIWELDQFVDVLETASRSDDLLFPIDGEDLVFFSWPTHYQQISRSLPPGFRHERLIHIVQNVRHGNPRWIDGYATRLLARPLSRIMISHETMAACEPWLNQRSLTSTIVEGHHWPYFHRERHGPLRQPVRVGYTTWKSEVGVRLEALLADDPRFEFESIRRTAGWPEIAELYRRSDVFLGCPGPEEGFYLVGLEALAAGCLLVMPDAIGNRAYAGWGENCTQVPLEDEAAYADALLDIASWEQGLIDARRASGYAVLTDHGLESEQEEFGSFLEAIESNEPAVKTLVTTLTGS